MIISELIAVLDQIRVQHGDLEVVLDEIGSTLFAIRTCTSPRVQYVKTPGRRESKRKIWSQYVDKPESKSDELVVHIP